MKVRMQGLGCIRILNPMHTHASQTHILDNSNGPTSNGHNSLNINPNHKKLIFKLNPKISNFK